MAFHTLLAPFDMQGNYYDLYLKDISPDAMRDAFLSRLGDTERDLKDYLASSVLAFGDVSGQATDSAHWWVEKTPTHENYAPQAFEWWPEARFIHVVRDPRDVHATVKLRVERKGETMPVDASAFNWLRSIEALESYQAAYSADRYMWLRYEDLCQQPEKTLRRVIGFLGIDWDDILYTPTKSGGAIDWGGNSSRGRSFDGIDTSSIGRWRVEVPDEEIATLEALIKHPMVRYDYPPEVKPPAPFARTALLRAKLLARRLRSNV